MVSYVLSTNQKQYDQILSLPGLSNEVLCARELYVTWGSTAGMFKVLNSTAKPGQPLAEKWCLGGSLLGKRPPTELLKGTIVLILKFSIVY